MRTLTFANNILASENMAGTDVLSCDAVKLCSSCSCIYCCLFQSVHVTLWIWFFSSSFFPLVTGNIKDKSFECQLLIQSFPHAAEQNTAPKIDLAKLWLQWGGRLFIQLNQTIITERRAATLVILNAIVVFFSTFMLHKASVKKKSTKKEVFLVFPTSPLCNGVIIQDQRSTLWLWELLCWKWRMPLCIRWR